MAVTEADAKRLLTLERQFCIKCWADGKRVQVVSMADAASRPGEGMRAATKRYRQLRRRRLESHLKAVHS